MPSHAVRVWMPVSLAARDGGPRRFGNTVATAAIDPTDADTARATRGREWFPVERLAIAVIEQAIADVRRTPTDLRAARDATGAAAWIAADDWADGYSFRSLCDVLELDPDAVRRRLGTCAVPKRRWLHHR